MRAYELKKGCLYISEYSNTPLLFLGYCIIPGSGYMFYRFLSGKEVVEFEWTQYEYLSFKELV